MPAADFGLRRQPVLRPAFGTLGFGPAFGIFADVGADAFEGCGIPDDGVVEPFLPCEIAVLEIPPDTLCGVGFELADGGSQGLRSQVDRCFVILWRFSFEDQDSMQMVGHDDPFIQPYPIEAVRDLFPLLRNDFSYGG